MSTLSPEPRGDGSCPVCDGPLLLVENLLVRKETLLAGVEKETDGDTTFYYPQVTDASDEIVTETISQFISCASLECQFVFRASAAHGTGLGDPERAV